MHVSPHYQRQGIGSMLIKEAIKAFPSASEVDLDVEKQNHRAFAFYQKHGFKEIGEKVFEVKDVHISCRVMEKTIQGLALKLSRALIRARKMDVSLIASVLVLLLPSGFAGD